MKKVTFYLSAIIAILCVLSCKHEPLCNKDSVCVKLKKYTFEDKLKVCITLFNNSDQDYYITGFNRLVFGLNITKEIEGSQSDARFEFYKAPYKIFDSDGYTEISTHKVPDYTEERKKCGVEIYGPISKSEFEDTITHELQKYVKPEFYVFMSLYTKDTIEYIKSNLDCIFIPKHSEISDSYEICSERINFDKLAIQFNYPNDNMAEFDLWFGGGGELLKKQIEYSRINYPDTLLGYIHYTKSITSELLEITK